MHCQDQAPQRTVLCSSLKPSHAFIQQCMHRIYRAPKIAEHSHSHASYLLVYSPCGIHGRKPHRIASMHTAPSKCAQSLVRQKPCAVRMHLLAHRRLCAGRTRRLPHLHHCSVIGAHSGCRALAAACPMSNAALTALVATSSAAECCPLPAVAAQHVMPCCIAVNALHAAPRRALSSAHPQALSHCASRTRSNALPRILQHVTCTLGYAAVPPTHLAPCPACVTHCSLGCHSAPQQSCIRTAHDRVPLMNAYRSWPRTVHMRTAHDRLSPVANCSPRMAGRMALAVCRARRAACRSPLAIAASSPPAVRVSPVAGRRSLARPHARRRAPGAQLLCRVPWLLHVQTCRHAPRPYAVCHMLRRSLPCHITPSHAKACSSRVPLFGLLSFPCVLFQRTALLPRNATEASSIAQGRPAIRAPPTMFQKRCKGSATQQPPHAPSSMDVCVPSSVRHRRTALHCTALQMSARGLHRTANAACVVRTVSMARCTASPASGVIRRV